MYDNFDLSLGLAHVKANIMISFQKVHISGKEGAKCIICIVCFVFLYVISMFQSMFDDSYTLSYFENVDALYKSTV